MSFLSCAYMVKFSIFESRIQYFDFLCELLPSNLDLGFRDGQVDVSSSQG